MRKMHRPAHPGEVLRDMWLEPLGMSIAEAARRLGVTRKTLSLLVNGHASVSPEMAVRLSKALGTSAALWVNMQAQYDLAEAERRRHKLKVQAITSAATEDRAAGVGNGIAAAG